MFAIVPRGTFLPLCWPLLAAAGRSAVLLAALPAVLFFCWSLLV